MNPKLLEILVCPLTKGPLEYDEARQELISRKAGLAYPIRDGIPIMLENEAREITEAEAAALAAALLLAAAAAAGGRGRGRVGLRLGARPADRHAEAGGAGPRGRC